MNPLQRRRLELRLSRTELQLQCAAQRREWLRLTQPLQPALGLAGGLLALWSLWRRARRLLWPARPPRSG